MPYAEKKWNFLSMNQKNPFSRIEIERKGEIFMRLTFKEIREKAIVNLLDGSCYGYASDLVLDTETKSVLMLVIKGRARFFGLFGREEDIFIPWDKIETIGKDTILVRTETVHPPVEKKWNFLEKIFNYLS